MFLLFHQNFIKKLGLVIQVLVPLDHTLSSCGEMCAPRNGTCWGGYGVGVGVVQIYSKDVLDVYAIIKLCFSFVTDCNLHNMYRLVGWHCRQISSFSRLANYCD